MTKVLEQAVAEVERLSDADQEQIGRKLLSHIEKLHRLRAELDKGIRSPDEGRGAPLDIEKFIADQHARVCRKGRRPIIWSPEAQSDLAEIWEYYAQAPGRHTADAIALKIANACGLIEDYPLAG